MNNKKTNNRSKGQIGEDVATRFLVKHGFTLIERNYLKKWGEIDIVARKGDTLHIIEVKSSWSANSGVVPGLDRFNPAENVHFQKRGRLRRVIQTYLAEKGIDPETPMSVDVAVVTLDERRRVGRVTLLENVIL